jgi:2-oxoglutarate ferredoxin oxidoreductase subunit gamma
VALRYSIRFSGAGWQGLIQAARILAEASAIYDDKNAAESCSYGPEARGSASRAEVIISDRTIDYPKVDAIDFLIALTQEAYDRYKEDLLPTGTLVTDCNVTISDESRCEKLFSAPFVEIAEKTCGKPAMVNMVTLGFFAQINEVIAAKSIRQAILARIPKKSEDIYMKAYESGLAAAREREI